MKEILEQIYNKKTKSAKPDLEAKRIKSEMQSARDRLYKKLNDEEKAIFDEYQSKAKELLGHMSFNAFLDGYHTSSNLLLKAIGFEQDPKQEQNK